MNLRPIAIIFASALFLFGLVWIVEFINGYNFAREPWFVLAPIDLLVLPGLVLLLIGTGALAFVGRKAFDSRRRFSGVLLLVMIAWAGFLLPIFTSFHPRLYGMASRAKSEESAIVGFADAYRRFGEIAIADSKITQLHRPILGPMKSWVTSNDGHIEVRWGSGLTGSWGFRVSDTEVQAPLFVPTSDAKAKLATDRVTVFMGIW